ncbi:response regulator [uncultured Desulfobacter sp.]|uniref:ATP-binding response regulator n=1 Tax=uncultured Desulfobacter sp. TaxID=240139 RepID=UPI0029F5C142|nr:response regulator [uncultured Desulfobacter sp.]
MNQILVIDDKPDNLVAINALLNLYISPCEVITAKSGREGLELAMARKPDTILLDIHMPEMDGFEVLTVLKNNPGTAHIPVVILTAMKTTSRHRVRALEQGAEAFLTKPINEAELAAQVKAMLRIKKAEDLMRQEKLMLRDELRDRVRDLEKLNALLVKEVEEHRQTEKNLMESEVRFQKVFNSQLEAIFIVDNKVPGRVIDCNSAACNTFGYEHGELAGEGLGNLFVGSIQHQAFMDMLEPALNENGFLKDVAFSMKRKDGTVFPSEITVFEMRNQQGEKGDRIVSVRDLTERKQLESILQQAQKMESIGTLAGGIAHDFNNILSPLIGFAELLEMDLPKEGPEQENLAEILKAAFRAKELVKQILTFSRQTDRELMQLKLQPILKEVTKLLKASIPKTILIETKIGKECGLVKADPTEIHQIVMNLATNAYHAMEENGGTLVISLEQTRIDGENPELPELPPGRYACLSIKDTGTGIDAAIMKRLFDPYFTTKETGKGTGLGLSVVQGIVQKSHGEIRIDSKVGEGTEVQVFLPVVTKPEDDNGVEKTGPLPCGTEHILFVDDEEAIVRFQTRVLERLGYTVTECTDSRNAFDLFKANPSLFDLLISDMTMPHMTGERLVKECLAVRPDLPVIICTGFSEQVSIQKMESIGIKGFLMKPVDRVEIAWTIRKCLDKNGLDPISPDPPRQE